MVRVLWQRISRPERVGDLAFNRSVRVSKFNAHSALYKYLTLPSILLPCSGLHYIVGLPFIVASSGGNGDEMRLSLIVTNAVSFEDLCSCTGSQAPLLQGWCRTAGGTRSSSYRMPAAREVEDLIARMFLHPFTGSPLARLLQDRRWHSIIHV